MSICIITNQCLRPTTSSLTGKWPAPAAGTVSSLTTLIVIETGGADLDLAGAVRSLGVVGVGALEMLVGIMVVMLQPPVPLVSVPSRVSPLALVCNRAKARRHCSHGRTPPFPPSRGAHWLSGN
jgi:hypothetical protein